MFVMESVWDLRKAKAWKVWRNDTIAVGQPRDQFTILKRRCWETMKQQHDRSVPGTGFSIKHFDAICLNAVNRRPWDLQTPSRFLSHAHFPPHCFNLKFYNYLTLGSRSCTRKLLKPGTMCS